MERYFEGMKYVFTSLFLVFFVGCGHPQEDSDIVRRYVAAGGGDPATLKDFQIQAWFSQHQAIRGVFEQPCAPLLVHYPSAGWLTSAEGKVCSGERRAKQVEYKSDGSKF